MSPARNLQRAHRHATRRGVTRGPLKWQAVALAQDVSAGVVFGITGNALLAQLRANEAGALAGRDAEYLHQMRVTVRRLRALLALYRGLLNRRAWKKADKELKWLARALGPARDSDVFVNDIWPPVREVLGAGPLVNTLAVEWLAQQRRNARIARRALASRRYRDMMFGLERWFLAQSWCDPADSRERKAWQRRARGFARDQLQRCSRHVRGRGHVLEDLDAHALHRLRIEIKNLRYMMDALEPLFRHARVKKMLESLSALQDILGTMNDVEVAAQKIDAALPKSKRFDIAQLRDQIAAWQGLRLKGLKRKLNAAWRAYRRARPFW